MTSFLLNVCESWVAGFDQKSYFVSTAPQPLDTIAALLCDAYVQASAAQRSAARQRLAETWMLDVWTYHARKFFALSVRQKNSQQIVRGLTALAIDDMRYDWRETVLLLAVGGHCAKTLGRNFRDLCSEVLPCASEDLAGLVSGFLDLPPQEQTIEYKGARQVQTPDGVWFELFCH